MGSSDVGFAGALDGSVTVVLWNTRYLDAIVDDLRVKGHDVRDEDVARLPRSGHAHLNCLGRYAFAPAPSTASVDYATRTGATTPTWRSDVH